MPADTEEATDGRAYAFVLGTGRCGSTLVHEVLAGHPVVGFISNVEDLLPLPSLGAGRSLVEGVYRRLPPAAAQKGRPRLAPSEGYLALDREVSPLLSQPLRDLTEADATPWLASRLRRFFSQRAAAGSAPLFLHKFTGWPRARLLHAVLPGARFVHVVRDGRAVANSWLQMPWWLGHRGPSHWHFGPLPPAYAEEWERSGRSFVLLAGLAWKLLLDAFEEARRALPPASWKEVRYEDVVADPPGRLSELLGFLGLEPTADFEGRLARHRFDGGRAAAYREELGLADLALLESSLGDHLAAHGYT